MEFCSFQNTFMCIDVLIFVSLWKTAGYVRDKQTQLVLEFNAFDLSIVFIFLHS